jgi:hypothetical protein
MKFMLLLCGDPETAPGLIDEAMNKGCARWAQEMASRGVLLGAGGLRPAETATTVRVRNDEVLLTDGPFAETKEQIGGYTLIECADLDEALEITAKHPWAKAGKIEVRPIWQP